MGIYSDNFYSWCDRQFAAEKVCMDSSQEWEEEKHPRENGGRFTEKPEKKDDRDDYDPKKPPSQFKNCTPEEYHETIKLAKSDVPEDARWRVDVKPISSDDGDDYNHCNHLFKSKSGSCAAVKTDGDIVSVCRVDSEKAVSGSDLLKEAIKRGGDRLDSFDGNWRFYVKNGFEPISWTPFNEEYAPDGWEKERDEEEDIIFFAYTGRTD